MFARSHSLALCFILTLCLPEAGWAARVLSNLGQAQAPAGAPVSTNAWQASSITIASDAPTWTIETATLSLETLVTNPNLQLAIVANTAFRPDLSQTLVAFGPPTFAANGHATFAAQASPTPRLPPGASYWIVLGVTATDPSSPLQSGLYRWHFSQTQDVDAGRAEAWSFGSQTASAGTFGSDWTPDTSTPYTFAIEASRPVTPMTLSRWRAQHPGGHDDTSAYLASDDDHNGLTALAEFGFAGDAEHLPAPVRRNDGVVGLTYVRWSHAPELIWTPQFSTDLDEWQSITPEDMETTVSLLGLEQERVHLWVPQLPTPHFLRIAVSRP